ncbi:DDB1- and CUL4-associated factor 11 [Nilaparvata lugens]|uniref:DDB1- and CUL4-associated factor 11 n=1 Tax=Nilaparvata lugens TaxID=108931 RepID=UPI00193DF852|nr:DDB1- and CUL4-associated factor 11 [Nilaparvata lugens]
MGTSHSRRMDSDSSSVSSLESQSEHDSDFTAVLEFLVASGHFQVISTSNSVDDDYEYYQKKLDRSKLKRDTKILDGSEISLATKQASGQLHAIPKRRPTNIVSMINARQEGMFGSTSFTKGDKCRISNERLPKRVKKLDTFGSKAFCGVYSQDGDRFLVAAQDRLIRLYNCRNGFFKKSAVISAKDVGWSILDTAFSPDGNSVAYSSWSEKIHIIKLDDTMDVTDAEQVALPLCPDERRFCIFALVFSADGNEVLGGANDGNLYVYDRTVNRRTLKINSHSADVNTVAFADSSSQILYSGGDDGYCKVWDRRTLNERKPLPVGVLAGHVDGITHIDSRGDGRHLISNSKDQTIKLWDIRKFSSKNAIGNAAKQLMRHDWDYRWQKVPRKLIHGKSKLEGDTSLMTYRGHLVLQTLIRCHFSPAFTTGQSFIITGCASGQALVYDVLTGKIVKEYDGHLCCVRDVAWHPYRSEIVTTSWDNTIKCWSHDNPVCSESDCDDEVESIAVARQPLRRSKRLAEKEQRMYERQQREASSSQSRT